ncbi:MAG: hypothetical protein LBC35_03535 [Coriobacteriales bacterium]|nr:hypothetical protein [Coriobacteriales bacterium]
MAEQPKNAKNPADSAQLDDSDRADQLRYYALGEAKQRLEQNTDFEPFTALLHGENIHVENHPGADVLECLESAVRAVTTLSHVAEAYAFAYSGYVNTNEGSRDALIVEHGLAGAGFARAYGLLYRVGEEGEGLVVEDRLYDLGQARSLFDPEALGVYQPTEI